MYVYLALLLYFFLCLVQILGTMVAAVSYHYFWKVSAEGSIGGRVFVADEFFDPASFDLPRSSSSMSVSAPAEVFVQLCPGPRLVLWENQAMFPVE